jgi:hypothetical protein
MRALGFMLSPYRCLHSKDRAEKMRIAANPAPNNLGARTFPSSAIPEWRTGGSVLNAKVRFSARETGLSFYGKVLFHSENRKTIDFLHLTL